jgi:hypothetical protein
MLFLIIILLPIVLEILVQVGGALIPSFDSNDNDGEWTALAWIMIPTVVIIYVLGKLQT